MAAEAAARLGEIFAAFGIALGECNARPERQRDD
jgi:hypothetical protein